MVDNRTKRPASGLKRKPWILILEQNAYFYSNEAVKVLLNKPFTFGGRQCVINLKVGLNN